MKKLLNGVIFFMVIDFFSALVYVSCGSFLQQAHDKGDWIALAIAIVGIFVTLYCNIIFVRIFEGFFGSNKDDDKD